MSDKHDFDTKGGALPRDPNPPTHHERKMHQPPTNEEVVRKIDKKLKHDELVNPAADPD